MIEGRIEELIAQKFTEEEFQDCFLVEIRLHPSNKLEVFIDCDSGMTLEKCQKMSRYLEETLDEEAWLGEKYTLEVSSPGIDRPLLHLRQYQKNVGRKVKVDLKDGKSKVGKLLEVDAETILLEERVFKGNNKQGKPVEVRLPFDQIEKTIVQVSFK